MKLLILGPSKYFESPTYRGTERTTPYYYENLDEDHEVNQAFLWYCAEGGEYGIVSNLVKSKELVQAYNKLDPPQHFEIVAISKSDTSPFTEAQSEFLGFDLSSGYGNSLLSWGLEIDRKPPDDMAEEDIFRILHPLLRLVKEFFQPSLNPNGLFSNFHTANFCLECMMALQRIRPGLWENDAYKYDIVGLWKLKDP